MSGATPGPWNIHFDGERNDRFGLCGSDAMWVATVHLHAATPMEANARLIAAAPDLLEAAKAALRLPTLVTFSETESSSHYHGERRADEYAAKADAVLDQLRAAIARAEANPDTNPKRARWDPEPDPEKREAIDSFAERDE